ncbi:MAG: hypothetical protein ASARMPREDX12_008178 [Alectoria sarmentosa]|nr:MAG: hypothetical protein ASARMPREDX12_008178 [Alectoria sarmentosa]
MFHFEHPPNQQEKACESQEANSFIIEEYEQQVEGVSLNKRPKDEDSVIPSAEFPPSSLIPAPLPPDSASKAAPSTRKSRAKSQPTVNLNRSLPYQRPEACKKVGEVDNQVQGYLVISLLDYQEGDRWKPKRARDPCNKKKLV